MVALNQHDLVDDAVHSPQDSKKFKGISNENYREVFVIDSSYNNSV